MPDLDPELQAWLSGGQGGASAQTSSPSSSTSATAGTLDPELSAFVSSPTGQPKQPATAASSSGGDSSTPLSLGGKLLSLLQKPVNAVNQAVVSALEYRKEHPYTSAADRWTPSLKHLGETFSAAWQGAKQGWEHPDQRAYIADEVTTPEWRAAHPALNTLVHLGSDLITDPLMHGGAAAAKGLAAAGKAAGALALGTPEAATALETLTGPLTTLAKTSKPVQSALEAASALGKAAQAATRSVAGQFSLRAALSGLPKGEATYNAIREFMGRTTAGQIENRAALKPIAEALRNTTPEEKQALAFILDQPAAAEAEQRAAQVAANEAAEAQRQAALNYQARAPWDTEPPPMQGVVDKARESVAQVEHPEFMQAVKAKGGVGQPIPADPEAAYMATERMGIQNDALGPAAQLPAQANPLAGVPEHLQPAAQAVLEKYGDIIPQIRKLTDESYAKILKFAPETGYQPYYYPRISRAGAEGDSGVMAFLRRLGQDETPTLSAKSAQNAALTQAPGFTKERVLDTLGEYANLQANQGRHAVLDPVDALLTHMDRATLAAEAGQLRDKLLAEGIAVKSKQVPPGYMDLAHIKGWEGISVPKEVGKALTSVLTPPERGAAGVLYDKALSATKSAAFYNPLVHGKNLAFRAGMTGQNPIVSAEAWDEVKNFGPTLRKLIEHGGATEYLPRGEEAANQLYSAARRAAGEATAADRLKYVGERLHNSLWDYDKALRVDLAKKLQAQGMSWPEIADKVNATFGKPLDPTQANLWLRRLMFTPAWTFNNLAWNATNVLNPRVVALRHFLEAVNQANTGHGMEENPQGKEEYVALTKPRADNTALFVNPTLPTRDLTEMLRDPTDYFTQRLAPIPHLAAELYTGNSRPGDTQRGLDYNAPGAGGPLIGYGSNGWGPDVSLRTQAIARAATPLLGFPAGTLLNEGTNAVKSANPLRDIALRLGGMYASDVNEKQAKAYEARDAANAQRQAIRAKALRAYKAAHK